jgi:diguanylate cyclase (GGDEF)-like protein
VEPVLTSKNAHVPVVLSAQAALDAMLAPDAPHAVLLDARLPALDLGRLLAALRVDAAPRFPIVLFSDTVSEELNDRLAEGVLDDLFPTTIEPAQLSVRIDSVMRAHDRIREIEMLRNALARGDRLTGAYTRDAILSMLFRETDRVQRMNTSLCLILLDIDDFTHWNGHLGSLSCDLLLVQVAGRVRDLLRSYDLLGRVGKDEFLAGLPGCSAVNAVLLAERIRNQAFGAPFHVGGASIRLTACFGVVASHGRSPVVVLREAEDALRVAREGGPETIQFAAARSDDWSAPAPGFTDTGLGPWTGGLRTLET